MLGGADELVCDESGVVRFTHVSDGAWMVRVESAAGDAAGSAEVLVEHPNAPEVSVRLEPVDRVFGRIVDADGKPVSGVGILLGPKPKRLLLSNADGRFAARLESETQQALTIFDMSPGGQKLRVRSNEEMTIVVGPQAILTPLRLSIRDEESLAPVKVGSVRVYFSRSWNRDTSFSCGEAWVAVSSDGGGKFRCIAFGYDPVEARIRDLEPRDGAAQLFMRKARNRSAQAVVRVRLRFRGGERPEWIGLYDAGTGRAWHSPTGGMEFYWLTAAEGILVASGTDGYVGPTRFSISPDADEPSLEVQLMTNGGRVQGVATPGARVELRDSGGRLRRLVVDSDGAFRTGQLAPGRYSIRADGADWVELEVKPGADTRVELP